MQHLNNQRGVALMGVLVAVMILGLLAGIAGSTWTTTMQRAREQELLWRGNQYRKAIEAYYQGVQSGAAATLPTSLEQLLKDPRSVETERYLRKLYPDPLTGKDWLLVKGPGGGIAGVRSSSPLEPFKKDGFIEENRNFAGKQSYREWQFVFKIPTSQKTNPATGAGGTSSGILGTGVIGSGGAQQATPGNQ